MKRDTLKRRKAFVRKLASANGHALGPWRKHGDNWRAVCILCDAAFYSCGIYFQTKFVKNC